MNNAPPLIFNLFPRYFHTIDKWAELLPHAARMGFNHVFVNPFHATGFSGSLYSVQDYFRLNPYFLKSCQDPGDWSPLKMFIEECAKLKMRVIMDLVINHTAVDSPLVNMHPEWYTWDKSGKVISPFAVDPADNTKITVWGDLAKINYESCPDKSGLWEYADSIIKFFQNLNIRCFRCDAAYQVPTDLWKHLIASAKTRYPDTVFFAETLGCRLDQVTALDDAGFDYLFNSSKWWGFDAQWCLEQHEANSKIAPSISFPESHDTERLSMETSGNIAVQKSRYVLAAVFSEGILMPMGYEYGARIKMDVVKGTPADAEEKHLWDISGWIAEIHRLKLSLPVLSEEGKWLPLWKYDDNLFFMEKKSNRGNNSILVCINKQAEKQNVSNFPDRINDYPSVICPCSTPIKKKVFSETISMEPMEIILFTK